MDFARSPDAARISQWWASVPQLDSTAMQDGILDLYATIHGAMVDEDWDEFNRLVRLYRLGESLCRNEPQISLYEYGQLGIELMMANRALSRGEHSKCAEHLTTTHKVYQARMQRYAELGIPPRPASEVVNFFLLVLAFFKWLAAEEWRDFILAPAETIGRMQENRNRIVKYLAANPGSHRSERNLRDALALCELAGLKVALRYEPQMLPDFIGLFNDHFQDKLSARPGHYAQVKAVDENYSAFYWDFELAKLRFEADPPLQDVYQCIELRSLAAHSTFGDWRVQGLLRNWRREALIIVRELKAKQGSR